MLDFKHCGGLFVDFCRLFCLVIVGVTLLFLVCIMLCVILLVYLFGVYCLNAVDLFVNYADVVCFN